MYKTTARVDGMMCGMCEAHIQDAISNAFAVKKVKASRKKGTAEILSEKPISEEELHRIIDPTGYTLISADCQPFEKKGLKGLFKR